MEPSGVLPSWIGARAYDPQGQRVGHVADVLFDARSHRPEWLLLVLARGEDAFVLVPVTRVRQRADGLVLGHTRDVIRSAPAAGGPPDQLTAPDARTLARHYGVRCGVGPWLGVAEPALARGGDRVRMRVPRAA